MSDLGTVLANPWPYVGWTVVVLATLALSYVAHPHVFGFATFVLGGLSVVVGIAGMAMVLLSKTAEPRARAMVGVSIAVTAIALIAAFGVLRTFKWA